MTPTDPPRLDWLDAGRGFVRDSTGRFDLVFSEYYRLWVAIDWNHGKKTRHVTLADAKAACDQNYLKETR